jgi:hypothetical protein
MTEFLDKWKDLKKDIEMEYIQRIRCVIFSDYEYARWVGNNIRKGE